MISGFDEKAVNFSLAFTVGLLGREGAVPLATKWNF